MNPFEIKEVQELLKSTSDVGKTTKAFENAKNEVKSPRHITTINEGLAGQTYPGTNVEYRKHTFTLNGEKVEGVFLSSIANLIPCYQGICATLLTPNSLNIARKNLQNRLKTIQNWQSNSPPPT